MHEVRYSNRLQEVAVLLVDFSQYLFFCEQVPSSSDITSYLATTPEVSQMRNQL